MFAITPRFSNDYGLLSFFEELGDPYSRYQQQRDLLPVHFGDGTIGHIGGRIGGSQIENADKEFRIRLDLSHYKPEEVKITMDSHKVTVHAKHEERQDNHGFVSREMTRTYKLPNDVDVNSASSTMNANGTLSIKMSKSAMEIPKEVKIPVEFKKD
ncbi:hypothetical protein RRG08_005871 [Elysia crispata]|uniref:SHSP domain-containing protein n=1 Tax=Elysia crispata TaxID=231223 RepID=A0AAE0YJK5_9GAST|nr:hypothetical protein RRG08_005871 [Elysia crispata]